MILNPRGGCLQYIKDSNLKANHNYLKGDTKQISGIYHISKIVI